MPIIIAGALIAAAIGNIKINVNVTPNVELKVPDVNVNVPAVDVSLFRRK